MSGQEKAQAELLRKNRAELNALAGELGVDEPGKLKNKAAVVDAIVDAGYQPADADAPDEPETEAEGLVADGIAETPLRHGFDVVGEDGRRIVRWYAESEARSLAARISGETGERLEVVASK